MQINVDIYDIASEKEIKTAVLDAIQSLVVRQFGGLESNLNRLVSNLSYHYVYEMVDRQYDGELDELLKSKIADIINELSSFVVFRRKDVWDKEDSVAYKILREELANARPLIKARVEKVICEYPLHELTREHIGETISECIMDKLFDNDKEKMLESD